MSEPTRITFDAERLIVAAEAAHQLLEQGHMILGHVTVVAGEDVPYRDCLRCRPMYTALLPLLHMAEQQRPKCAKCSHLYADHGSGHDGCSVAQCECPFSRDLMIPLARLADLYNSLGYQQAIREKEET